MPYKSDAQRRFFHAALNRGQIAADVVHEFDQASKGMKLPEHAHHSNHDGKGHGEQLHHEHKRHKEASNLRHKHGNK